MATPYNTVPHRGWVFQNWKTQLFHSFFSFKSELRQSGGSGEGPQFPKPKALRSSKSHSGHSSLFPLLLLLPPKVRFLYLEVVATTSPVILAVATMEVMVMDVVNGAPIPLDVKFARLKATLLIVAGAIMNVWNLRHNLLKLSTHLVLSQMV